MADQSSIIVPTVDEGMFFTSLRHYQLVNMLTETPIGIATHAPRRDLICF
jgi:hypothetical protein